MYLPRIHLEPAEVKRAKKPRVELWIDDGPRRVLTERYFEELLACNVKTIAVMVDTAKAGWDPIWSTQNLEKLGGLAGPFMIGIVLTTWPDPRAPYLKAMGKGVIPLIEACGAEGWEVDTEFNWRPNRVVGFRDGSGRSPLDLAGDMLVDVMMEAQAKTGVRLELTTFTSHTENGRAADVAPLMDVVIAQAYSVRKRPGGTVVSWDHLYGPGAMQKFTLDRTLTIKSAVGKPAIGVGLPAWDQTWPGHSAKEAMQLAYDTAVVYKGLQCVRYWSSKWIVGARRKRYANDFLKGL